jgi:hypothetical protein
MLFTDEISYWRLGQGLHQGEFSTWYFLDIETPDTLRTWGYPFFLYVCTLITKSQLAIKLIQLLLLWGGVYYACKLIAHYRPALAYRSLFLVLLTLNNHIFFYTGTLMAETFATLCILFFIYVHQLWRPSYYKFIVLALLSFILYQMRPVFILLPFILFLYYLLFNRAVIRYALVFIGLYTLSLLPFGIWNNSKFGKFKPTPLEGGVGVAYFGGYWQYCLPRGFVSNYYYGLNANTDMLQPQFVSQATAEKNAIEYEKQWEDILFELRQKYFTTEDSLRETSMDSARAAYGPGILYTYSGSFTIAREKMMKTRLIDLIKTHPGYFLKTRVFIFFRQWVNGLDRKAFNEAHSLKSYFLLFYPFVITFLCILGGFLLIVIQALRRKLSWKDFYIFYLFIGYQALINLPFGAGARYTAPVHLIILMLVSIIIGDIFSMTKQDRELSDASQKNRVSV